MDLSFGVIAVIVIFVLMFAFRALIKGLVFGTGVVVLAWIFFFDGWAILLALL